MIIKKLVLCSVLTFSWVLADIEINGPCKLQNLDGICIPIKSCTFALTILSINDIQTLRNMFCGFNGSIPKVCCPISKKNDRTTTKKIQTAPPLQLEIENDVTAPPQPQPPVKALPETAALHTQSPIIVPVFRPKTSTRPPPTVNPLILPGRDVCGPVNENDRIYGGDIADIDEFPWLARIKMFTPTTRQESYSCHGTLINDRYVLTVAHCLTVSKVVSVRLGEWNTETEVDCYNGYCNNGPLDVNVEKSIIHPNYDKRNINMADIALLRLEHPVEFTEFIKPVCLPTTEYIARQDYVDSTFTSAGWGLTEFGQPSVVQRKVNLDSVHYSICTSALPSLPETEDPYVICAGGKKGRDTCRGDSGGPLLRIERENNNENWFIFGITSYGARRCGSAGKPAVYTRVSKYMDWILETINED